MAYKTVKNSIECMPTRVDRCLVEIKRLTCLLGDETVETVDELKKQIDDLWGIRTTTKVHYRAVLEQLKKDLVENTVTLDAINAFEMMDTTILHDESSQIEASKEKRDLLEKVKKEKRDLLEKVKKEKRDLLEKVKRLTVELDKSRKDLHRKSAEVNQLAIGWCAHKALEGKSLDAMSICNSHKESISPFLEKIHALENELASAYGKLKLVMSTEEYKMILLPVLQRQISEAERGIVDGEEVRRKLHNTLLDLQGKIRVFCRARPPRPGGKEVVSYPKSGKNVGRGVMLKHNKKESLFVFDKVFDHLASQEYVFTEISELVQSALDGYKVEILEIYNEAIHDVLDAGKCEIREDADRWVVLGLKVVPVWTSEEVIALLKVADQKRTVAKTDLNAKSSRSHLVFTLGISGENKGTKQDISARSCQSN